MSTGKKKSFFKNMMTPVDLTVGKPYKVLLKYGAPIMLSYLLQQIYVLTDAIICGQVLTSNQVAGVNDTSSLTFIFLQFALGCTAGFSVITAQHVGAKDMERTRQSFAAQIVLSFFISIILTVVAILILPWLLSVVNVTPTNKEVYDAAYEYCFVIFIGIFTQMGYNLVCGVLRAYGDSVTPLVFLIISTLLNVGLDLLFLAVFKMGPMGAAIATVIAQFISMIASFVYTMIKYKDLRIGWRNIKSSVKEFLPHLKQGIPLGFQFSILAIGLIVMQSVVVKFDIGDSGIMVDSTPAQNGYGVASKVINLLMAFNNGLGSAILGFNAQNYGKGNYENVRKGTLQAILIMLIISVVCAIIGCLLTIGGAYQYIFMSADKINSDSIKFGNVAIYVDFGLYAILGFLIVIRGAIQGVGKVGYVLGAGVAELVARVVICSFLPVLFNGGEINSSASLLSYGALCFGDPGAWLLASIVLTIPLFKNIIKMKY